LIRRYQRAKAKLGLKRVRPWQLVSFVNPARKDGAEFRHWRRLGEETQEYAFAKFDKKIVVETFTEKEYYEHVHDVESDWSYAETQHLFDLCARFDMRFIVVHDRFDRGKFPGRTLEAMKDRYYKVVNILHKVRQTNERSSVLL
jgi:DNA methyltransferase 1-associated protein 1